MIWSLYLVRTRDGALYTGIALDVDRRVAEHEAGVRGAKSLRGRGPLELVYRVGVGDRGLAQGMEHRVKKLAKAQKERLVAAAPSVVELKERLGVE